MADQQDQRIHVLLIEDNPDDAQVMQEATAGTKDPHFEVEWLQCLSSGLERLAQGGVDLVLTDLTLPDAKGVETVASVHAKAEDVPIVVLTSERDEALALQALRQGAEDYLVKGHIQVYPDLLVRALRYAIGRKQAAAAEKKRVMELDKALRELAQTQAMLIQAEKLSAVGQLASGIAHEVKNPLNIILQAVNYLEAEVAGKGGRTAEILQVMREAVMTADKIIRGLLDFSKPAPLQLKPTSIGAAIDAALLLVQNQLSGKRIGLTKAIAPDAPLVLVDDNQIKQVFLNLMINAIQAMPNGGEITLRSYAKELTTPGGKVGARATDVFRVGERVVVCEVQDTGLGIPQDILPQVFNPFFTTKPPGEGVGLGLSITASIVHAHRGIIDIESEVGRGTIMRITLPACPSEQVPAVSPGAAGAQGTRHAG